MSLEIPTGIKIVATIHWIIIIANVILIFLYKENYDSYSSGESKEARFIVDVVTLLFLCVLYFFTRKSLWDCKSRGRSLVMANGSLMVLILVASSYYLPVRAIVYYTLSLCCFIIMSVYLWAGEAPKKAFSQSGKVEFRVNEK